MVTFNRSLAFTVLLSIGLSQASPQNNSAAVFVASTPCNKGAKPLMAIPSGADCEFMKWKLTFYPGTFKLSCTYGMTRPNTNGFSNGSTLEMHGKWSIIKGAAMSPEAIVYRLDPAPGGKPIHFVKLADDLLHLLDSEKRLMVGNPGWSYTFNKVNTSK